MQALAILLAVAATSVDSTGSPPPPLGLSRGGAGISLPTRANWDSFPTRDRGAPRPPAGIQPRAPVNSNNEIQPVDYESESLPDDPAAPPPLPGYTPLGNRRPGASLFTADPAVSARRGSLADTGSGNDNLGDNLAESRLDSQRRQEAAVELTPVSSQEERDPYAVPDLRGQSAAGNTVREPMAPFTPAARREPLDGYSPQMVNDFGSTRRENSLLPGEFDASPATSAAVRPGGGRRAPTAMPDHRVTQNPAVPPGPAPATSGVAAQALGGNLPLRETADSRMTQRMAPPRQQVAPAPAAPQPPLATHAGPVHQGAMAAPASPSAAYPQQQMVPMNPRTQYEERPWAPFFATLLALFASGGLNLYLGWIAWDTYNRYQELVADMRQETRQRERQRDRDRVRDKIMTTGAADYSF